MNKRFEKIIKLHEKEDCDYIYSREEILRRVKDEFTNADEIIGLIEKDKDFADVFFDYSRTPAEWKIIPVRKSDKFYIKKHTLTQRPYFHDHDFYEMIYVHKGKCVQYIYGGEEIALEEKSLCISAPRSIHALARCGKKDIILKAVIPSDIFQKAAEGIISLEQGETKVFARIDEQAEYCIYKLMQESFDKEQNWLIAADKYLSLLFLELIRKYDAADREFLDKAEEYFAERLREASLRGFAEYLGYSTGYAGRVVRKNTGKSFSELLGEKRLKKAVEMLIDTDMSVENIALEVGYKNPSGFYKQFCMTYGITPKEYRKTLK